MTMSCQMKIMLDKLPFNLVRDDMSEAESQVRKGGIQS